MFYDETNKTKLNGCKRNHCYLSKSSFICISDDDDLHRHYDAWNVKEGVRKIERITFENMKDMEAFMEGADFLLLPGMLEQFKKLNVVSALAAIAMMLEEYTLEHSTEETRLDMVEMTEMLLSVVKDVNAEFGRYEK